MVPADSDLVVRVMMTTGDNRPLIGDLHRRPNGRKGATPTYFCTGCTAPAVMLRVSELVSEQIARAYI